MKVNLENMVKNIAEKALDEYTYNGKTLRQIADTAKWISVKDELPEFDQKVLVYAVGKACGFEGSGVIAVTHYTNNWAGFSIERWNDPWAYFSTNYEITHWMLLPEAPKMDGEG